MVQSPIVWENREMNLHAFGFLFSQMCSDPDIVILPETFSTGFSMDMEKVADTMDGVTVATIRKWASEYNVAITGSFIVKVNGNHYNRAFFITPQGEEYYYDKRHLFRMGKEDRYLTAGDKHLIIPYKGWNICLMVCYDLRFPVWSRNVNNAYDLLIYVANWPEARQDVWDTLLKARAMENIAYVCGVNRTGKDGKGIPYKGGSVLYGPKGDKGVGLGSLDTVIQYVTIQKSYLTDTRETFPAWKDADTFTIEP